MVVNALRTARRSVKFAGAGVHLTNMVRELRDVGSVFANAEADILRGRAHCKRLAVTRVKKVAIDSFTMVNGISTGSFQRELSALVNF